jgi:hypothetical protein
MLGKSFPWCLARPLASKHDLWFIQGKEFHNSDRCRRMKIMHNSQTFCQDKLPTLSSFGWDKIPTLSSFGRYLIPTLLRSVGTRGDGLVGNCPNFSPH